MTTTSWFWNHLISIYQIRIRVVCLPIPKLHKEPNRYLFIPELDCCSTELSNKISMVWEGSQLYCKTTYSQSSVNQILVSRICRHRVIFWNITISNHKIMEGFLIVERGLNTRRADTLNVRTWSLCQHLKLLCLLQKIVKTSLIDLFYCKSYQALKYMSYQHLKKNYKYTGAFLSSVITSHRNKTGSVRKCTFKSTD